MEWFLIYAAASQPLPMQDEAACRQAAISLSKSVERTYCWSARCPTVVLPTFSCVNTKTGRTITFYEGKARSGESVETGH